MTLKQIKALAEMLDGRGQAFLDAKDLDMLLSMLCACGQQPFPTKVYAVMMVEADITSVIETAVSHHKSKPSAEAACAQLNKDNTRPMQRDYYGPVSGSEYVVQEIDLQQ
ncbi:hypothetical protein UFOVP244_90 [uncultured Caudovirales phage]|uniref:Uncharacterized protein n=1 Tax=uncultured Caudovirales phage TaxID=2100421 RepID=A0A6J7WTQ5_9CAUD|nr:hypothetical protein UFOVP244_90 [uncultured Caudovirales phage]